MSWLIIWLAVMTVLLLWYVRSNIGYGMPLPHGRDVAFALVCIATWPLIALVALLSMAWDLLCFIGAFLRMPH